MRRTMPSPALTALAQARPDPADDYAAAMARCATLRSQQEAAVNPACESWTLTHGTRTERVVVLVHGITNCPAQYVSLAPLFHEQGNNVIIPRIPWNGLLDRSGEAMRYLTAQELRQFGDDIIDIARGLGERITIVGLSGGGVIAAWAAQCRPDVERAVVIAPAIGVTPELPIGNVTVNRLAMRLAQRLPNIMTQRFMPIKAGPAHNYLGFATRGLAAVMELGFAVLDAAASRSPAADSIEVVLNANDHAVNAPVVHELLRRWLYTASDRVDAYTFGRDRGLLHDLIDPAQPAEQTEYVYPILMDLIAPKHAPLTGATR